MGSVNNIIKHYDELPGMTNDQKFVAKRRALFAKDIKIYRTINNMTQAQLAAKCNVCRRTLTKAECMQHIHPNSELKIAAVVDCWSLLQADGLN